VSKTSHAIKTSWSYVYGPVSQLGFGSAIAPLHETLHAMALPNPS